MDAAHTLLRLAHSCLARTQAIATAACPAAAPQLQQLAAAAAAGPVAAAQQQLAAVGMQLLSPAGGDEGSLELRAALAAEASLQALQRAAAVEGLAAVVSLRLQEVG